MALTRLKILRMGKGERQWDIAKRIGISDSRYSKIENGLIVPKDELLEKIADALGVAVNELR